MATITIRDDDQSEQWTRFLSGRPVARLAKHMPGRHNQKDHGRRAEVGFDVGRFLHTIYERRQVQASLWGLSEDDFRRVEAYFSKLESASMDPEEHEMIGLGIRNRAKWRDEYPVSYRAKRLMLSMMDDSHVDPANNKIDIVQSVAKDMRERLRNKFSEPPTIAVADLGHEVDMDDPYEIIAAGLVDAWAAASADSNPKSIALQRTVARRFNLRENILDSAGRISNWDADDFLERYGDIFDAFVDSVYDQTQKYLKAKGVDRLTLYRGVSWKDEPDEMPEDLEDGDPYAWVATVATNPLSSFSLDLDTGLLFARVDESTGRLLTVTVPRERVFSTFITGPGCTNETEIVVLGDTVDALVIKPKPFMHKYRSMGARAVDTAAEYVARGTGESPLNLAAAFIDDEYNQDWPKRTDDRLETLLGNPDTVNKHLPGRHDQKDHGRPAKDEFDVDDFLQKVAYGGISFARNIWALNDDDFLKAYAELKRLKRAGKGLRSLFPHISNDAIADMESAIRERAREQKRAPISCRANVFQAALEKQSGDDKENKISVMKSVGQAMRQRLDAKFGELPDLMNMSPEELSDLAKSVARRYLDEYTVTGAPMDPETARFELDEYQETVSRPLLALVIDDEDGQEHSLPVNAEILRYIDKRLADAYELAFFPWSDDIYENIAAGLVDTWATSSSDGIAKSVALQRAVARRFNLHDSTKDFVQTSVSQEADELLEKYGDFFDAFVDSVYENTQNLLKDFDKVTLYRGVKWGDDQAVPEELRKPGFDYAWGSAVGLNPLSSFSSDLWTAMKFAGERDTSRVLAVTVPRERVFSTFITGPGCTDESEIVVLGDTVGALVIKPRPFMDKYRSMGARAVDAAAEYVARVTGESPLNLSVAFIDDEQNQDWPKRTNDRLDALLGKPSPINKHLPGRHDQKDHAPSKEKFDVDDFVRRVIDEGNIKKRVWALPDNDFVELDAALPRLQAAGEGLPSLLISTIRERAHDQNNAPISCRTRVFEAALNVRSNSPVENKIHVMKSVGKGIKERLEAKLGGPVPDLASMPSEELSKLAERVAKRYIDDHPDVILRDRYTYQSITANQLTPEGAWLVVGPGDTETRPPPISLIMKDKRGLEYELQADDDILSYIDQRLAASLILGSQRHPSDDVYENIAAGLVDTWARSSSDHNVQSIALQRAVARRFQLRDSTKDFVEWRVSHAADELLEKCGDVVDAFVDAVYDQTQNLLKDFDKVTLYRGVHWGYDPMIMPDELKKEDYAWASTIDLNPISSFSSIPEVALSFAGNHYTSRVFAITVPRDRIFATFLTGPGCTFESEVIVLGDTAEALVLEPNQLREEIHKHGYVVIDQASRLVDDSPLRLSAAFIDDEQNQDWPKRTDDRLETLLRNPNLVNKHLPGRHDQKDHGTPAEETFDVDDFLRTVREDGGNIKKRVWALPDKDFLELEAALPRLQAAGEMLPFVLISAIRERAQLQQTAPISCRARVFGVALDAQSKGIFENKIEIMQSVGKRMKERLEAKFGGSLPESYIHQRIAAERALLGLQPHRSPDPYESLAAGLVDTWAGSSSDSNARSIALQRAVARRFNLHDSTGDFAPTSVSRAADELLEKYGEFVNAFVDTVYEHTQDLLKDFDKVTLYRGVHWAHNSTIMPKELKTKDYASAATVGLNPLSSFTYDLEVALAFAGDHRTSRVLAVTIPRDRIFSTFLTGPGCTMESEIVVLGDTADALVLEPSRLRAEIAKYEHAAIDRAAQLVKDSPLRLSVAFIDDEQNQDWPKRTDDRLATVFNGRNVG
jgi:uncharacterized protein (DUF2267 family)